MIDFLDNYENKNVSRYPCLSIDWITDFEIRYIQSQFSNYVNSLDELSELNTSGYNSENLYEENEEPKKSEEKEDLFEDLFNDSEELLESKDLFGDLFSEDIVEESEVSLDDLLNIVEQDMNKIDSQSESDDLFNSRLPVIVSDEKIAEIILDKSSIKKLNHFFKRNWILELSDTEKIPLNDKFFINNILNL